MMNFQFAEFQNSASRTYNKLHNECTLLHLSQSLSKASPTHVPTIFFTLHELFLPKYAPWWYKIILDSLAFLFLGHRYCRCGVRLLWFFQNILPNSSWRVLKHLPSRRNYDHMSRYCRLCTFYGWRGFPKLISFTFH